jgi:hypothetical protein
MTTAKVPSSPPQLINCYFLFWGYLIPIIYSLFLAGFSNDFRPLPLLISMATATPFSAASR